jgi:hypothetical protein
VLPASTNERKRPRERPAFEGKLVDFMVFLELCLLFSSGNTPLAAAIPRAIIA